MEKIQSFNDPPEKICPKCGGELERLISAPAIQFKGAGWYVNDYAKPSGAAKSSEAVDGKADSKPGMVSEIKAEAGKNSTSSTDSSSSGASSTAASASGSPITSSKSD